MRSSIPKPIRVLAVVAILAMVAVACGDGGGDTTASPGDAGTEADVDDGDGAEGGEFSIYICEPEHMIPSNAAETCGSQALSSLFRGLINYDTDDLSATFEDAVGESITTEDNTTFTVKLKDGWTFHNGDPVDAQAFVDTWNFTTYAPNAQQNANFLSNIEGYEDVNPSVPEGESEAPEPSAETLSGLTVVDDLTFEVTLSESFAQWPLTVGYTAFFPLPSEAFDDPESYEQSPIGNGPFQMDGDWEHNQVIRQVRYEDYAGSQPAKADAVNYQIYADLNTAYNDLLAGNLDIMDSVPPEQLESAKQEFGDRFVERPSSVFQFLGIPMYDEQLGEAAGENGKLRRQALSLAMDRQAIADTIFNGTVTPAHGFVSPVVPGARDDACPDTTHHDPERATELWEEAGGYEGTMTVWFNAGGGHDEWVNAVANQWRQTLGIEEITFEQLQFAEYLQLGEEQGYTGPFRLGWAFDYPSPQNYLEPLYGTSAQPPTGSNFSFYSNEEFDDLIAQGNQQDSLEEGIPFYQQAEDILCEDLPVIPNRFNLIQGAHSENVSNVTIDAFTQVHANLVTVNQ